MLHHTYIRRIAAMLAVALTLIAVLAVAVPWKPWIETRLEAFLETHGFRNVRLSIAHIGLDGIALRDISVGDEPSLNIKQISLGFSLSELYQRTLRDISLTGLELEIKKTGENWIVSGLQAQPGNATGNDHGTIPVTVAALAVIPLDTLKLDDSHVRVVFDPWQIDAPIGLTWRKQPVPELVYEATGLALKAKNLAISTGALKLTTRLLESDKKWDGQWNIDNIKIAGADDTIPLLMGSGTLSAEADHLMILGQFANTDQMYKTDFRYDYFLENREKSRLTIIETRLPWNGGIISVDNLMVPLAGKRDLNFNLKVRRVSLAAVLQQMTGKETTATGVISGLLPVAIGADGVVVVRAGKLAANEPGIIAMPPNAIPGDNPQVALTREVLKNFHYTLLSVDVDQDKDRRLSALMKIEGSNPDVYDGRVVKLNVHLTGDVLNFVQQNLLILTNPEKLLQQGKDATY